MYPWLFFYAPTYHFGCNWKWQNDSSHEQLWGSLFQITLNNAAKTYQTAETLSGVLHILNQNPNLGLTDSDRYQLKLHIDQLNDLKKL